MHTKVFNAIANAISFFKYFRLERVLIVALAGFLILSTTACNPGSPKAVGEGYSTDRVGQSNGMREYTNRPDEANRPGLNSYNDNDSRQTKAVEAKAKALIDRAEQNARKVQNPQDFADSFKNGTPLDERVRNLSEDVGDSVEQFKEDLSRGAKDSARALKSNTERASQNTQQAAEDTAEFAQDQAQNAADAVRNRT